MKMFKLCKPQLNKHRLSMGGYILLTVLVSLSSILSPYLSGSFIDALVYGDSINSVYWFCAAFTAITLIRILVGYVTSLLYVKMQAKMGFELNQQILMHVQQVSLKYVNDKDTSQLNQMINNDANTLIIFCITFFRDILTNGITLLIPLVILSSMNIQITFILAGFIALYTVVYHLLKKPIFKLNYEYKDAQNVFFAKLHEQLYYLKYIKMNGLTDSFRDRLTTAFGTFFPLSIRNNKFSFLYSSLDSIIFMLAQICLFLVGGIQIYQSKFTVGMFTIFSSYFSMILSSARFFFNLGKSFQEALVSYDRLMKILQIPIESCGAQIVTEIEKIQMNNVGFQYVEQKDVLQDFSLLLERGHIVGLVGPNGSGKSTIINLILGLYIDDVSGSISVNTQPIHEINVNHLRLEKIGISEQEPTLVSDTIRSNLTHVDMHDEDIRFYIDLLGLGALIDSLPQGLDSKINQMNTNLSGGEKQKISIIRAIIKNPDLLILDEPTSALDAQSKRNLYAYLQQVKQDKIIVIISHETDLYSICDRVIDLSASAIKVI